MPSTPRAATLSKKRATRSGSASLKSVQLMLTRKPCAFASAIAVQVHRQDEIGAWPEQREPLLHQQRVRAQIDELAPRDDPRDDRVEFLVQQRLAPRNGDHPRAALVPRGEAIAAREPLGQAF